MKPWLRAELSRAELSDELSRAELSDKLSNDWLYIHATHT